MYTLNQKVDKNDPMGIGAYNMSKFPNSYELRGVGYDDFTGKYVTGLDENAPEILNIQDKSEKEKKQKEIIEKRTQLEAKFGKPGLLDCTNSSFWDTYNVPLEVDATGKTRIDGALEFSPLTNPKHELYLITMKANGQIPLSREESYSPEYRSNKFFLTTEQEEASYGKHKKALRRQKEVEMNKLFGDNPQYERAWNIAFILGLKPKVNILIDALDELIDSYVNHPSYGEDSLQKFLNACKLDNEDLLIRVTFQEGINLNIIKHNRKEKLYFRGGTNYRDEIESSVEFLKQPAQSTELAGLIEAVKKIKQNRKNTA